MNLKHLVNMLVALSLSAFLTAQQTDYNTNTEAQYRQGLELYNNGKYSAAQQYFDRYLKEHDQENSDLVSNSEFYSAMSSVKLFNNDAESRTLAFLAKNPENPLRNEAILNLAGYFYQRKSYNKAMDYYSQVETSRLSRDDLSEYYFKSGYCYFLEALFGLGTVPALFFTGLSASLFTLRVRLTGERVAACSVIVMGIMLLVKGAKYFA